MPIGFLGGVSGKQLDCQCRRHTDMSSTSSIPGLEDPLEEGTVTCSSVLA